MNVSIFIFNILLTLFFIGIIIVCIFNLIAISRIPGYSGNPALKNAYNYSFFTLGFGIFGFVVLIFAIIVLSYDKYKKSRPTLLFGTLIILAFISICVFSGIGIFNYNSTYSIISLVLGILGLILGFVYLALINRLSRKLSDSELIESQYKDDLAAICKTTNESKCANKPTDIYKPPDLNQTEIVTLITQATKEPYYDYL